MIQLIEVALIIIIIIFLLEINNATRRRVCIIIANYEDKLNLQKYDIIFYSFRLVVNIIL